MLVPPLTNLQAVLSSDQGSLLSYLHPFHCISSYGFKYHQLADRLSPSETLPPWTLDPLFSVGGRDWGWRMECSLRDRSSPTRAHSSESWITGNSLQTLSPTTYSTSPLGCLTLTSNLLCPRVSSFSQSNGNCTLPVAQVRGHNLGIVLDLSLSNLYLLHQQLWLTLTFKIYPEFNLSQPLLLPGGSGRLCFAQITVKASQWSPQLPPCLCDSQLPRFRPVLHCSHSGAGSCLRRDALTLAWETPEEPATPPTVLLSSLATVGPLAGAGADQAIPMSSLHACCTLTWGHSADTRLTHYLTFQVSSATLWMSSPHNCNPPSPYSHTS